MIIRHDIEPNFYYISSEEFPAVIQVNSHQEGEKTFCNGMGMLIHSEWILTAAHVAGELSTSSHSISVGQQLYSVKQIVIHPDWKDARRIKNIKHDIALIQLESPVITVLPLSLYSKNDEVGQTVTFVGRGDYGNGLEGVLGADNRLRKAHNRIEEADPQWLVFRFDEPPRALELEGISGPGDSGGPALIKTEGGYFIAGISSAQSSEAEYNKEKFWRLKRRKEGIYGVWEYYTRVSKYLDWIHSIIS